MVGKLFFTLQYWLNNPPWDTNITPPELFDFLDENPPGFALDLGCGTGTNVLTIASYGWRVTGIDFVPRAIQIARRKAHKADLEERVNFLVGNVLDLDLDKKFDLILDIGCYHSLLGENVHRYAMTVSRHLKVGGTLLLYVHKKVDSLPGHGSAEDDLATLGEVLSLIDRQDSMESNRPSAWLRFEKKTTE
jgi:SAM-dependent methyltransferase